MEYNGHKNWTHWNVALWLYNDEGVYQRIQDLCSKYSINKAAAILKNELPRKTPDGASYSLVSIKAAIEDEYTA